MIRAGAVIDYLRNVANGRRSHFAANKEPRARGTARVAGKPGIRRYHGRNWRGEIHHHRRAATFAG